MGPAITHARDLEPERAASGAVVRTLLDTTAVGGRLVRRLVDVAPEACFEGTAGPGGELWFVISGGGRLELDGPGAGQADGAGQRDNAGQAGGAGRECGPRPAGDATLVIGADWQHGVRVPPGASYRLRASGDAPVQIDAVALPGQAAATGEQSGPLVSDLRSCAVETTGNRRFRVLFGPGQGCAEATQFVGEIPPGRAPEHSHAYDEVVLILAGQGVVHTDGADHPLGPGTCVYLPPGQPHCLENTGQVTLVVLGVFQPGGSPAAKKTAS
jgi:mannose-6-phosphate isomerase-like protein (cupin superfamily)